VAFLDLFSETASIYAASRPSYPDALFARLAALTPSTAHAWDCATGSGQAALGIAGWFDRVDATDASAAQIQNAVAHERVRYSVAPAEASGLPDGSVDLVSMAQALHWIDRRRFYAEARRVLKPGGLLAVYGYSWFYVSPEIDRLVDQCLLEPIAGHWAPNIQLLWDGGIGPLISPWRRLQRRSWPFICSGL
jgi:ubiquinone/menaquinone biosynthesis C-methylase UbiE